MRMNKSELSAILILALIVAGLIGLAVWESNRSPLALSALRKVKPGATQDDIRRLFGAPQDVHDLFGDHRWCYYRTNSTRIVYVIFDTNMLYKAYELDD
jgi:outer membrane protein assembly factor BamE (lipoprotein component of BamABCDE complex)